MGGFICVSLLFDSVVDCLRLWVTADLLLGWLVVCYFAFCGWAIWLFVNSVG